MRPLKWKCANECTCTVGMASIKTVLVGTCIVAACELDPACSM